MTTLRVALCQLNPTVGALDANVDAMLDAYRRAEAAGADLAVFGELAVCGYPPEDLLLKRGFLRSVERALERFAAGVTGRCVAVVGTAEGVDEPAPLEVGDRPVAHRHCHNAAVVIEGGRIVGTYRKQALPNYGVFDEVRYFEPGPAAQPLFTVAGVRIGVTICEDVWLEDGPAAAAVRAGAELLVNLNASPYYRAKEVDRRAMLRGRAGECGVPIVYVNQVGGQDELLFDGGSMVVAPDGSIAATLPPFVEAVEVVSVDLDGGVVDGPMAAALHPVDEVWQALVLGTRDYVRKNGFSEVTLGLSGGVDSSLVAAIAADALGPERVHGVLMPSRFSSEHSVSDAVSLAERLGIDHRTIAIEDAHAALLGMLAPSFGDLSPDLTEENLQSRIRGVLLMALSNKFGWLVLTTGNKSEVAVGYSTLYGDSAGGLAVIKDVPKLLVYELCRRLNEREGREIVPEHVLTKPPSAELRPDQRDDQSLPPYEVLDPLIEAYVDRDATGEELVAAGFDAAMVARIVRLIDIAEYKRRQSPPGLRISRKAFGRDRRLPITNRYL